MQNAQLRYGRLNHTSGDVMSRLVLLKGLASAIDRQPKPLHASQPPAHSLTGDWWMNDTVTQGLGEYQQQHSNRGRHLPQSMLYPSSLRMWQFLTNMPQHHQQQRLHLYTHTG